MSERPVRSLLTESGGRVQSVSIASTRPVTVVCMRTDEGAQIFLQVLKNRPHDEERPFANRNAR
jgi:hypothetical protein